MSAFFFQDLWMRSIKPMKLQRSFCCGVAIGLGISVAIHLQEHHRCVQRRVLQEIVPQAWQTQAKAIQVMRGLVDGLVLADGHPSTDLVSARLPTRVVIHFLHTLLDHSSALADCVIRLMANQGKLRAWDGPGIPSVRDVLASFREDMDEIQNFLHLFEGEP